MQSTILLKLHQQLSQFNLEFNDMQKKIRLSSVAMVFRVNPIIAGYLKPHLTNTRDVLTTLNTIQQQLGTGQNIYSVLFLQRAFSEKDPNSGNLCLPGGKCDGDESDLTAAIRETQEESAVQLKETMLIGKMKRAYYARKNHNETLYMTTYLFLLTDPHVQIKLNEHEVIEYKWVDFKDILTPQKRIVKLKINAPGFLLSIAEKLADQFKTTKEQIESSFQGALFPSIDIGMSFLLFGLTFYVMMDLLGLIVKNHQELLKEKGVWSSIVNTIQQSSRIDLKFSRQLKNGDLIAKRVVAQYKRLRILPDLNESRL